ncbi:MAG: hypothetical protein ACI9FR_000330 [Cryomorphaceae bacterium]|jgi:hypothetical protein
MKTLSTLILVCTISFAVYTAFFADAPIEWETPQISPQLAAKKCIAGDGKVYYGKVPKGVSCDQRATIQGSLTVLGSQDFNEVSPRGSIDIEFRCDGRTRCPQMTSCSEAKFFLNNCPAVKMDGDYDGVPCEEQWC